MLEFSPQVNQTLTIEGQVYRITEHPFAPGIPYGQAGRKAVVYQLAPVAVSQLNEPSDQAGSPFDLCALKVFHAAYRVPRVYNVASQLSTFAGLPGLEACQRAVITASRHRDLLRQFPALAFSVLMPWIEGATWQELMLGADSPSPAMCLRRARALLDVLVLMEERGLAHCDLSGANLIVRADDTIALVDLEDMYGPGLARPEVLPAGSSGYAHRSAPAGLWHASADRFAGAVLISEILSWCDPQVRALAWSESYFPPDELQISCARYDVLWKSLRSNWNADLASLLEQAWSSEILLDCPLLTAWAIALPDTVPEATPAGQPVTAIAPVVMVYEPEQSPASPTPMAMLPCPSCGHDIPETSSVCLYCEQTVTRTVTEVEQKPVESLTLQETEELVEIAGSKVTNEPQPENERLGPPESPSLAQAGEPQLSETAVADAINVDQLERLGTAAAPISQTGATLPTLSEQPLRSAADLIPDTIVISKSQRRMQFLWILLLVAICATLLALFWNAVWRETIDRFLTVALETPTVKPMPTAAPVTAVPTRAPEPTPMPTAVPASPPLNAQAGDLWQRPADGMFMVYVPAGPLNMGGYDGADDERPFHRVTLDGFWIDRTEVTTEEYLRFLNDQDFGQVDAQRFIWVLENPNARIWWTEAGYVADPEYLHHPVVDVSWYGAEEYCDAIHGRLPTEAEWEYAARGPLSPAYPWGDAAPTCGLVNFSGCAGDTVRVGSYPDGASWIGAWDLAGNVCEWTADWYAADYYSVSPPANPPGPGTGQERVLRGGSYDSNAHSIRAANRSHVPRYYSSHDIGFRCVVSQEIVNSQVPCRVTSDKTFDELWKANIEALGCPLSDDAYRIEGSARYFERGLMLWRLDTDVIYAIYTEGIYEGTYNVLMNSWKDGDPENSCLEYPTPGYYQPQKVLGKAWCTLGGSAGPLGWAVAPEEDHNSDQNQPTDVELVLQDFEHGIVVRLVTPVLAEPVYMLFDTRTYHWELIELP